MDRENAPKELKWKLTDIFATHEEFVKNIEILEKNYKFFEKFKQKLSNFNILLKYFELSELFEKIENKLAYYIMLNHDVDLNNNQYIEDNERLNALNSKLSMVTSYIAPELASLSNEYFENALQDARFKNYEYKIKSILDNRQHILSKEQEEALSTTITYSNGFDEVREAMTESDFKFSPVVIENEQQELTNSTYSKFLNNKDRDIRTQAYNNIYKVYNQFAKSLSLNYINFVKLINSDLKLRNYKSTFDMFNHSQKIPQELFDNLIENVDKNLYLEHEYFKLLKEFTAIEDFGFQDVYLSLSTKIDKKYTINEQKQLVFDALLPLGAEYQHLLSGAYNNNWIDFCTNKNKRSGGYMADVYGVHPYVLLNDNGDYDSLSTLAHELGHAMHSYFADATQPFSKHDYSIFIAEIASTVNEILLNKYMISKASSNQEKLFYLDNYIQHFKSTVFRQTMFAEFENFAHNKIANDEILSPEILDNEYKHLLTKHFKNIVKIDDNIIHEWLRIPHFYSPYYVYKYSTSFISAVYIANSILDNNNDMLEKYLNMLKCGGNGYPTEILAKAGIDLTKSDAYIYAFNDLKKAINEAKNILFKPIK